MNFVKKQKAKCGNYIPINTKKYIGTYPIRLMSSWEKIFCRYCDHNPKILSWSSEDIVIYYKHPFKRNIKGLYMTSKYHVDFLITVQESPNNIIKYLVEIKPYKETIQPKPRKSKTLKTKLYEDKTWAINSAKWKAAERYCARMGYKFIKITEKELIK
jgi:hypothetical protein